MSLYPTKTRLGLLRSVADGEVWQNSNGESVETWAEEFGLSDPLRRVTSAVGEFEREGWVEVVQLEHGARQWRLTDAGREVLEANR